MINKQILQSRLTEKFSTQLLHAIVFECFINGLPIDASNISNDERKELQKYTYDVVQSIGGIKAVENAVDFQGKTLEQNVFLGEIYDACMESAKACARRNSDAETDPTNPANKNQKLPGVIDKAALSESDYKSFSKKVDAMSLDTVSKVIKDKTIAVIKDEQDQYEKEQELDKELKEVLKSDEEEPATEDIDMTENKNEKASEAMNALMDIYLDKLAPRHHITVFSRLQETAMEMMNVTKVGKNGEDYFPIIRKVTFESFFKNNDSQTVSTAMESLQRIASEEVCEVPVENRPKYATLVSIVVYTIMETLKTMGIYCPSQSEIQGFVNKAITGNQIVSKDANEVCNAARKVVTEAASLDLSKMNSNVLGNKMVELKSAIEMVETVLTEDSNNKDCISIASEASKYIQSISEILHQRNIDQKATTAATESFNTKRQKSNDLSQFNRIRSMFASNPQISEIQLRVDPNKMSSVIDVHCVNEAGYTVADSYMNMEYACESNAYLGYLKDTFEKSKMTGIDKHVSIILKDGKGTKISLK